MRSPEPIRVSIGAGKYGSVATFVPFDAHAVPPKAIVRPVTTPFDVPRSLHTMKRFGCLGLTLDTACGMYFGVRYLLTVSSAKLPSATDANCATSADCIPAGAAV